ncbi:unnamed protein product [Prorocentrum cordatum]|uniref:Uncharacterized protein n=1 Tax=Prorocentrum cordatum TaxID=2364126 RepID=A0ABN9TQN7_9DINO|nr:unnamed protein product [Polarella glacialis]
MGFACPSGGSGGSGCRGFLMRQQAEVARLLSQGAQVAPALQQGGAAIRQLLLRQAFRKDRGRGRPGLAVGADAEEVPRADPGQHAAPPIAWEGREGAHGDNDVLPPTRRQVACPGAVLALGVRLVELRDDETCTGARVSALGGGGVSARTQALQSTSVSAPLSSAVKVSTVGSSSGVCVRGGSAIAPASRPGSSTIATSSPDLIVQSLVGWVSSACRGPGGVSGVCRRTSGPPSAINGVSMCTSTRSCFGGSPSSCVGGCSDSRGGSCPGNSDGAATTRSIDASSRRVADAR